MTSQSDLIAGTAVGIALDEAGPLCGILFIGPSGCGKSSIALEIVETCPWRRSRLVGDDHVLAETRDNAPWALSPPHIAGMIEVRGFGPAPIASCDSAKLAATFDLGANADRLPEPGAYLFGGHRVPLWPLPPSFQSPGRLRVMLRAIIAGQTP